MTSPAKAEALRDNIQRAPGLTAGLPACRRSGDAKLATTTAQFAKPGTFWGPEARQFAKQASVDSRRRRWAAGSVETVRKRIRRGTDVKKIRRDWC